MKFRGKAITSSTILSVLGVLCFAAVLVSASVLLSTLNWTNTVVKPYEYSQTDVSSTDFGGFKYENIPANGEQAIMDKPYVFGIQVTANDKLVDGSLKITVTSTDGNAVATLKYWTGTAWEGITSSGSEKILTFTHALTTPLSGIETINFQLTYSSVDTYKVEVTLEGTAP